MTKLCLTALLAATLAFAGCNNNPPAPPPPAKKADVEVKAPGVDVKVDQGGVDVKAPGADVKVEK